MYDKRYVPACIFLLSLSLSCIHTPTHSSPNTHTHTQVKEKLAARLGAEGTKETPAAQAIPASQLRLFLPSGGTPSAMGGSAEIKDLTLSLSELGVCSGETVSFMQGVCVWGGAGGDLVSWYLVGVQTHYVPCISFCCIYFYIFFPHRERGRETEKEETRERKSARAKL